MDKVKSVNDHYEGLHTSIQYAICLTEDDMDVNIPSLDITSLRSISLTRAKGHFPNLDISFSPQYLPTELIDFTINSIQFRATNPKEQDLGCFTE